MKNRNRLLAAILTSAALISSSADAAKTKEHRSTTEKHHFEKSNPCPATGKTSGPCPGYVVDHVKPLACGGKDTPENMQWQTNADGKAKDKAERKGCAR